MDDHVKAISGLLQSDRRLERDRGSEKLKLLLMGEKEVKNLVDLFLASFKKDLSSANEITPWEIVNGCLLGAKWIVLHVGDKALLKDVLDDDDFFFDFAVSSLAHNEVRVRLQAGQLLGALCKLKGSDVYSRCSVDVLKHLNEDLKREIECDVDLPANATRPSSPSNDPSNIFHQSAGWRHLETTMKCLQEMIEGCGKSFNSYITQELLNLLFEALDHTNRFVRETGFNVCAAIVTCGQDQGFSNSDAVLLFGQQFCQHLAKGLADNWSQVRLASSIATRNFVMSISDLEQREQYFPDLLPRLCLNRYYIADGVRIFTQQTWNAISGGRGKDLVEKYISNVVEYYIASTKADNHAVREAACACISELAVKIGSISVQPYVSGLLAALLECFQDDSWPVRDAACIACGNFILNFADDALKHRDLLYSLFLGNLIDPIPSVRQGASVALAKYCKVYGEQVLPTVIDEIKLNLTKIADQPASADKYAGLDKGPAQFGVVKNLHTKENVDPSHTDQLMYSCGSLAPKMGRGNRGGCMDCHFRRPSEDWERADGSVYLITEVAAFYPPLIPPLLPCVVEALNHRHFPQHFVFLETVCKQLPVLAQHLGKRVFKTSLEMFLDSIFYALSCDVQLTSTAAEECLLKIGKFVGPNILKGRIENYNPAFLNQYSKLGPGLNQLKRPFP